MELLFPTDRLFSQFRDWVKDHYKSAEVRRVSVSDKGTECVVEYGLMTNGVCNAAIKYFQAVKIGDR